MVVVARKVLESDFDAVAAVASCLEGQQNCSRREMAADRHHQKQRPEAWEWSQHLHRGGKRKRSQIGSN